MNINNVLHKKIIGYKNGLSILEILIAVALVSFMFIPSIQILYSIQPQNILKIINRDSHDNTRSTFHDNGYLKVSYGIGGIWNPGSLAYTSFSRQACIDFDPISRATNSIDPHLFVYTREELGISTSTILTGSALVGQRLYISANSSSTTEPDVFMYDLFPQSFLQYGLHADKQNSQPVFIKPTLTLVQSKNFGPGASSIQSRGTHIFLANTGVKNQVDVSDLELTTQILFTVPGSNSNTSPLTKVFLYASSTVVIATEKSVLPEIVFFDIDTGQVLHTIETGYGVNDMVIAHNILFVAGPRDPEIEAFDLNPERFGQKVGQYDLPGGSGNAKVLAVLGDVLYVGRTKGGNEFILLGMSFISDLDAPHDTSSQTNLSISFKEILNNKIGWSIDSLTSFGPYVILSTADEYRELQIYESVETKAGAETGISSRDTPEDLHSYAPKFDLKTSIDLPARTNSSMCFRNSIWFTFQGGSEFPLAVIIF